MFYLRKGSYEKTIGEIVKTDGTVIPERKYMVEERAVYKHPRLSRFYRHKFTGFEQKGQGMKVYQCKSVKRIMGLRQSTYDYCGEWFDVYDENGKVNLEDIMPPSK